MANGPAGIASLSRGAHRRAGWAQGGGAGGRRGARRAQGNVAALGTGAAAVRFSGATVDRGGAGGMGTAHRGGAHRGGAGFSGGDSGELLRAAAGIDGAGRHSGSLPALIQRSANCP
jgi:hypothetical protein